MVGLSGRVWAPRSFITICIFAGLLVASNAHARTLEEALDELGNRLGSQLAGHEVGSYGALQFTNFDGPQTAFEGSIADGVARRLGGRGSRATFIGLTPSERARVKLGLPAGANVAGETAARVAKLAGTDAMLVGTLRRIDSDTVEVVGQIFSAQRGINLADASITFNPSAEAKPAPAPPVAVAPRPPSQPAPRPQAPAPRIEPKAPPASTGMPVMTAEAGQFLIELHECRRSLAGVDCALVLNNQSDNAVFAIFNHQTRLFDDQGREYEPGITEIAGQKQDLKGHYGKNISKQVIRGVPTKSRVRFPNVSPDARSVASLQLNVKAPGAAKAEFRSVPILDSATASAPPAPKATSGASASSAGGVNQVEAGQFLIEITGCKRGPGSVDCGFTLINRGENAVLTIVNHQTRLFDDQGREYEPGITEIASERQDLKGHYGKRISKQVIGGVPTKGRIRFPGVAADARSVASLQFNLKAPAAAKAEFRSLPIRD